MLLALPTSPFLSIFWRLVRDKPTNDLEEYREGIRRIQPILAARTQFSRAAEGTLANAQEATKNPAMQTAVGLVGDLLKGERSP